MKIVEKKWGIEEILNVNEYYCFKKITVFKGASTSLQYHNNKDETSIIHSGMALFSYKDDNGNIVSKQVGPGFVAKLSPKVVHRFTALEEVILYECSTAFPGFEYDVVRLEDSYGREGTSEP